MALAVSVDGRQQILAGELLAVETRDLLIDSVDEHGQPRVVVRVPKAAVARGTAYVGSSPDADLRTLRRPPPGMRRAAEIRPGGSTSNNTLLVQLSRFPSGLTDTLLSRLLAARGQTEVGGPEDADLLDAIR